MLRGPIYSRPIRTRAQSATFGDYTVVYFTECVSLPTHEARRQVARSHRVWPVWLLWAACDLFAILLSWHFCFRSHGDNIRHKAIHARALHRMQLYTYIDKSRLDRPYIVVCCHPKLISCLLNVWRIRSVCVCYTTCFMIFTRIGTNVMEGCGRMVVTAVGINSQAGKILKLLGLTDESTRCCAGICVSAFETLNFDSRYVLDWWVSVTCFISESYVLNS